MNNEDLMAAVAKSNPVPSGQLTEAEEIRAKALLARTLSVPQQTQKGARGRHVKTMTKVIAAAGGFTVGLAGAAWATGVTPESVAVAQQVVYAADAGTVVYSYETERDGVAILTGIANSAKEGGSTRELAETVLVTSKGCFDVWESDRSEAMGRCVERSDWTLPNGNHRIGETAMSADGSGVVETTILWESPTDTPSGAARLGSQMVLGESVEQTKEQLGGIDLLPWQYVELYLGYYLEGIGLTSANRSAFSDMLSTLEPTYLGPAADSVGRIGEAFSITRQFHGYADEYRMVIDPGSGALLASENVLHGPWFIRGSRDHVTSSTTYLTVEAIADLAPCNQTPGCKIIPNG